MEASQSDELPAVSHLGQVRNKVLDVLVLHTSGIPIEAWGKVVGEESLWLLSEDAVSKLLGYAQIWGWSLHPQHISNFGELESSLDTVLDVTLDSVVSFLRSTGFPIEFEGESQLLGELLSLSKTKVGTVGLPDLEGLLSQLTFWEFLHDSLDTSLWEGGQLLWSLLVSNSEDVWVVQRVDI